MTVTTAFLKAKTENPAPGRKERDSIPEAGVEEQSGAREIRQRENCSAWSRAARDELAVVPPLRKLSALIRDETLVLRTNLSSPVEAAY